MTYFDERVYLTPAGVAAAEEPPGPNGIVVYTDWDAVQDGLLLDISAHRLLMPAPFALPLNLVTCAAYERVRRAVAHLDLEAPALILAIDAVYRTLVHRARLDETGDGYLWLAEWDGERFWMVRNGSAGYTLMLLSDY